MKITVLFNKYNKFDESLCMCLFVFQYHVTDDKTNNLTGFMRTVAKSPPANGNPGLYAMDCEMVSSYIVLFNIINCVNYILTTWGLCLFNPIC